jgi:putative SOS response-associated peptidase YedK
MCGRYVVFSEEENAELIKIINGINQRYKSEAQNMKTGEILPTDTAPVITGGSDASGDLHLFKWGFPNYMKSNAVIINARCESLHEKPTFRKLLDSGRCLVPASGFYEWKAAEGSDRKKDKYLIRASASKLIYFAGLYGSFLDKAGIPSTRFVIITTGANRQMSLIHSRMPVILDKSEAMAWISPSGISIESLLRPYGSELTIDKVG